MLIEYEIHANYKRNDSSSSSSNKIRRRRKKQQTSDESIATRCLTFRVYLSESVLHFHFNVEREKNRSKNTKFTYSSRREQKSELATTDTQERNRSGFLLSNLFVFFFFALSLHSFSSFGFFLSKIWYFFLYVKKVYICVSVDGFLVMRYQCMRAIACSISVAPTSHQIFWTLWHNKTPNIAMHQ